jgi:hypothetical protein
MDKKELREILSTHAERLRSGDPEGSDYTASFPSNQEELGALLGIAERVKVALVPVNPEPGFLVALERDLLESAARSEWRQPQPRSFWQQYVWLIVLAAAALASAASLVGIITFILRQRTRVGRVAS